MECFKQLDLHRLACKVRRASARPIDCRPVGLADARPTVQNGQIIGRVWGRPLSIWMEAPTACENGAMPAKPLHLFLHRLRRLGGPITEAGLSDGDLLARFVN